jgi:hypothetical protein
MFVRVYTHKKISRRLEVETEQTNAFWGLPSSVSRLNEALKENLDQDISVRFQRLRGVHLNPI